MQKYVQAPMDTTINEMVDHPRERLAVPEVGRFVEFNEKILAFFSDRFLASMLMFDIALIVPLLAIPAPNEVKLTLALISGSWIQWWALHALQRSQLKAENVRMAKADTDHEALTHIANRVDAILARLDELESRQRDSGV